MRLLRPILGRAVLPALLAASDASAQSGDFPISISTLSGPAEVQPTLGVPWVPAKLGAEIAADGGARTTGIGRMALRTKTGHAIRLGSATQVRFAGDASHGRGPAAAPFDGRRPALGGGGAGERAGAARRGAGGAGHRADRR